MKKRILGAAVLLTLMLSACSFGGSVMSAQYGDAQAYSSGAFSYDAGSVKRVFINWYCGSVTLTATEGDKLKVSESGADLPEEKALHWRQDGDALYVEFCASGYVGTFRNADKKLTVEIPEGIALNVVTTSAGITAQLGTQEQVQLQTSSGTVEVTDGTVTGTLSVTTTSGGFLADRVEAKTLTAETTSGSVRLDYAKITEEIRLESTSGGIRVEQLLATGGEVSVRSSSGSVRLGELRSKELTVKTTSGGVTLGIYACETVSVHTTSGSVRMERGPELGVSLSVSSTSGGFSGNGFKAQENGRYIWGDGACTVEIRTTSGSVTVK